MLRGLAALVRWAETSGAALPYAAVAGVVDLLVARYPDGVVRVERNALADKTTLLPTPTARHRRALRHRASRSLTR